MSRLGSKACTQSDRLIGPARSRYPEFPDFERHFATYHDCPYATRLVDTDYRTFAKVEVFQVSGACRDYVVAKSNDQPCRAQMCKAEPQVFECVERPDDRKIREEMRQKNRDQVLRLVRGAQGILPLLFYWESEDAVCDSFWSQWKVDWCLLRRAVLKTETFKRQMEICNQIEGEEVRHRCQEIISNYPNE